MLESRLFCSALVLSTSFLLPSAGLAQTISGGAGVEVEAAPRSGNLIPRDVFFGNPERAAVQISPDGTRLGYIAPHNGVMNVWVQTVGKQDARPVTNSTGRPIRQYFWAENNDQIIYLQDRGGDENWHLYAVDLKTGAEVDLTPFEHVQARVVASDENFPDEMLIAVNNRVPQLHDTWRVNTRTGARTLVHENTEGFAGVIADSQYRVRGALRYRPDGGITAFLRPAGEGEWTRFAEWDQQDALTSSPMGFTRDGKTLYLLDSADRNTAALFSVDVSDPAMPRTLVASSEKADLSGAVGDPRTGRPQAVSWEYARREWTILDPSIQKDWDYLSTVEDGEMNITSRSRADDKWVVNYVVDDGPVKYYLYDRAAGKATYLFSNRPALEGLKLAKMEPVIIPSRDGLELVSYLTKPVHGPANHLPMVLLVHGGPWARDSWGYNSLHQWLSNRGYAVLSVNFRGSTGFGKAFINAANREWAGKMHDDLIDAVNWAVEKGIADPRRVAIMGGSYGGYATLVGLTFTPDVFAAGVDIVGPSHVGTLLASIPPYWEPIKAMFETRVGAAHEKEYLDSISPLTRVDQIRRPLLIGQGKNDPRVKEAESEQIVRAMQERNIPVTYVLFPDEGHGFARPENSMAFFAVTEVFLAQHLGGQYQPIDDDVKKSSAQVPAGAEVITGLK